MERQISSKSLVQFESLGKFLQDAWLISFVFVFMQDDKMIAIPFVWVIILFLIAIAVNTIFLKTGYRLDVSLLVSVIIGLTVFLLGAPFWLFAAIIVFSVWRIQERYAKIQEDATHDGPFFSLLVAVFAFTYFLAIALNKPDALRYIILLAIIGLVLFMLDRMIVQWLRSKGTNQVSFSKVLIIYFSIISGASIIFVLIVTIGNQGRELIVSLFGGIIEIVLYPIGMFIEWLQNIFTNAINPQVVKPTIESGVEDYEKFKDTKQFEWLDLPKDLPLIPIIIIISIVVIGIIVWRLSKFKTEKIELANELAQFERSESVQIQIEDEKSFKWHYSLETNLVRDEYRKFEEQAGYFGFKRQQNETIREWFKREEWKVSEQFYEIYDVVRYSGLTMNSQDGKWFMKELETLTIKYLKEV
ncbi:hypothetical protein [Paenisporosarcina sp. TG20]|uniref:hypothetical protein n=1 Tax=Paenisporosarcina sp. TG20 TaxID=1211706 RepID=UPI0002E7E824|nr:hypothetical protein [Paenisporosarcina sp. TG20]